MIYKFAKGDIRIMETKILDLLEEEISQKQDSKNVDQSTSYSRGFGEGALAEAISLKHRIRQMLLSVG